MNFKQFYPAFIVVLLGTFLGFSGWSAYRAATLGSQISDPDYYSKGLKYNTTLVEKRAASVLGWRIRSELSAGKLQVRLLDSQGLPVIGANGQLTVFFPENPISALALTESDPGTYSLLLPSNLRGEIPARLDFERQGARINRQLLLNI